MELVGECGVQGLALDVGSPEGVRRGRRTPVQGGGDDVVAALRVGVVVSTGLGQVDLSRLGPFAVGAVDGHHPNGGPQPVAFRHAGRDFDAAVFDGGSEPGIEAGGKDGGHDGGVAGGGVGGCYAVVEEGGGAFARGEEVDLGVGEEELVVLEGCFDDELAVFDVGVFFGGLLEFAVAVTEDVSYYLRRREMGRKTYPKPPSCISCCQTLSLIP